MRSQAMPISRACSATGILAELPSTMVLDSQVRGGAQNGFPQIIGGDDREADGLAFFFGDGQNFGEEKLLDGAEKLVGSEIVFAGGGATQQPDVQDDDFSFSALGAAQRGLEVIERVIGAHRHQDVAGLHADGFRREFGGLREIELIEFDVRLAALAFEFFSPTVRRPRKSKPEKVTPEMVAAGLVKRFTMAMPSSVSVISASPTGISASGNRGNSAGRGIRAPAGACSAGPGRRCL